jgi:hypothetical protein
MPKVNLFELIPKFLISYFIATFVFDELGHSVSSFIIGILTCLSTLAIIDYLLAAKESGDNEKI